MSNALNKLRRNSMRRALTRAVTDTNNPLYGSSIKVANILRLRKALLTENLRAVLANLLLVPSAEVPRAVQNLTPDEIVRLSHKVLEVGTELHTACARQRLAETFARKVSDNAVESG